MLAGFVDWGLELRVGVQCFGIGVSCFGFEVGAQCRGFRVSSSGFRVCVEDWDSGSRFRVQDFVFRVQFGVQYRDLGFRRSAVQVCGVLRLQGPGSGYLFSPHIHHY